MKRVHIIRQPGKTGSLFKRHYKLKALKNPSRFNATLKLKKSLPIKHEHHY
jgi:hypothetical protein